MPLRSAPRRRAPLAAALACSLALAATPAAAQAPAATSPDSARPRFMLVVHGGAGTITRASMTPEMEAEYRAKMTEAIKAGYDVLSRGGVALDAVTATIRVLEDSPLFNAGKGAVFTNAGTNELDAAIMDGATLQAGAIAGVKHVKNPIDLARMVMEKSPHVMLIGDGAETFAKSQGMALVPAKYFWTQRRWDALQRAKAAEKKVGTKASMAMMSPADGKYGTVGAVALDANGNLAAGTSTGGTNNKRWGRVGDAPIIGAGTYANNASCAVSATGTGEFFIRNVVAHDICARKQYKGIPLAQAADEVVMKLLVSQQGDGGVIALDRDGNFATPFNTEGMYRGWVGPDGKIEVRIYGDEK
ncbi:MAG TPA: isoaspartyl peptidase/L-asparaginase [Gemmatimonadaceae bacterium]|nr:isoaspartyl peptidase/L-asparaginase [Gemmatimonadaceae bacterium]